MIEDHERRAPDVLDTLSTRPPEHHKRRATDMSYKIDIEHVATSGGQQICQTSLTKSTRPPEHHQRRAADTSDKLDIDFAAIKAPHAADSRYVKQA
ncbi:hypothetical protein RRG08_059871 [Elysia crispata]|uniref:Uncharacterized protein n=1 Tax=Elysia crispata TaxID=231223 RepID=A0AAE1B242_9GAST|nr:hypothetical protein RRG08_059871 [Elysia crispata]